jgi:branched-chain amino acid transport system permease protein
VRARDALVALVVVGLLLGAPLIVNPYWVRVLTKVFLFAVLASAWNLIAGYCGYPSFGQVVFFGLGAYATAVAMVRLHWPFVAGLALGVVLAGVFAVVVGVPVLRLRGHYFAVATLGVAEAAKQVVANLGISGGGEGISFPLPPWTPDVTTPLFYYAMGLVLAAKLGTLWLMGRARPGYAWRAIRANEEAAQVLGVNVSFYKIEAWTISALFTGLVGGIYGYWIAFIEPNSIFSANVTVEMVVIALLGGRGTLLGPVLGALVFEVLSELIWAQFLKGHGLVLAGLFGAIILFLPGGLVTYLRREPARPAAGTAAG